MEHTVIINKVYFQAFHTLKLNYTLLFIPQAFKFYCFTITTLDFEHKKAKPKEGVFIVLPKLTYTY
jgi:hypothetical protein